MSIAHASPAPQSALPAAGRVEAAVARVLDGRASPPEFAELIAGAPAALAGGLAALVRADVRACGERFELVPALARYAAFVDPARDPEAARELAHQVLAAARGDRAQVVERLAARHPRWRGALDAAAVALDLLASEGGAGTLPVAVGPALADGLPRYLVGEVLSRGSFGIIVEAHDRVVDAGRESSSAVVKFVRASADAPCPWEEEARRAAAIDHPCGVQVRDAGGLGDGRGYVVFERIAGRTLVAMAAAGDRMRPTDVVVAVAELCDALAELHAAGWVHGDLSPANVMIDRFGRLRMVDYGLSRPLTDALAREDVRRMADLLLWLSNGWVPAGPDARPGSVAGGRASIARMAAAVRVHPLPAAELATRLRRLEWFWNARTAWILAGAFTVSLFMLSQLIGLLEP